MNVGSGCSVPAGGPAGCSLLVACGWSAPPGQLPASLPPGLPLSPLCYHCYLGCGDMHSTHHCRSLPGPQQQVELLCSLVGSGGAVSDVRASVETETAICIHWHVALQQAGPGVNVHPAALKGQAMQHTWEAPDGLIARRISFPNRNNTATATRPALCMDARGLSADLAYTDDQQLRTNSGPLHYTEGCMNATAFLRWPWNPAAGTAKLKLACEKQSKRVACTCSARCNRIPHD
jgi:hypothetical protein